MTTLFGRAAAYIGSGRWDPGRLGSAIATLRIVRIDLMAGTVVREQCEEWHVRLWRDGAVAGINARGRSILEPIRCALLLQKGLHTTDALGVHAVRGVDLGGVGERFAPLHACGLVEEFLGRSDGGRRPFAGHGEGEFTGALESVALVNEFVCNAEIDRSGAIDALGVEEHPPGHMAWHSSSQKGEYQGGDITDGDLGVGKSSLRFGHHHIAGRREPASATDGGAVNGRDGEFGVAEEEFKKLAEFVRIAAKGLGVAPRGDLLQRGEVGAGREMSAGSREDHRADVRVVVGRPQCCGESAYEIGREWVGAIRVVEGEDLQ